jgi:NAD(P)-dependent dehydrogenase (short-subunit alcohol dehydrogenase family)
MSQAAHPLQSLHGRVALVTGAGRIGTAAAMALARAGASVVITDLAPERGHEAARHVEAAGGRALFVPADVVLPDQVSQLVTRAVAEFGRIDTVFCSAERRPETMVRLGDMEPAAFREIMDVNLRGCFHIARQVLPELIRTGGSLILRAAAADAAGSNAAYRASKQGLETLMRSIVYQYGPQGVRANAIVPIDDPAAVAQLVVMLASTDASYINGATLTMDALLQPP